MKNRFGKLYGFVLALVFCVGLSVFSLSASASGTYTLAVGDEMTLYSNIPSSYAVRTVNWTSNNYQAVEVTLHTNSYCKIRVNQYFSSPVIISCNYYYMDSFGGASYMRQGYDDFTINISKSGGSSGSTGSMTVSPSSVSLDLADGEPKVVTLKYDKGNAKSWSFGFLSENDCVELWETFASSIIGTDEVEVYAKKPGTDTVTCILYAGGERIASAKLNVDVTCSHKYDEGVVSVEPAPGKEGSMVYTCQVEGCGNQYEVSIPALPEEKEEDKKEEESNKEESNKEESSKENGKEETSKEETNAGNESGTNKDDQSDKASGKNAVKLNKENATIYPGQKLSLNIKNAKSGKKTWSSDNPKVASVNAKGKVTAKKPGTATIRVKTGGKTLICRVTVRKVFTASSSNISVAKGKKNTVTVTCGKKLKLKYAIKNKKIVSCSWKKMKGKAYKLTIRGKKKGKTTITLTNSFNKEKIKLTVKVG